MAKLAQSTRLFAGHIVYFAEYASGTSDAATKPIAASALWLEIGAVQNCKHSAEHYEEKWTEVGANGFGTRKDVFTLSDTFELTTREVSELYHRLTLGVAAPLVANAAQTPFAVSNRVATGWVKFQERIHGVGTDRVRADFFVEIRVKTEPDVTKKTREPVFELFVLASTLNSAILLPST